MKIELKNIKVNLSFSEETTMFKADLYINDVKVGFAENEGHGGSTNYDAMPDKNKSMTANRKIIADAEVYCKTLPAVTADIGDGKSFTYEMTLENFIDDLLYTHVEQKEKESFLKKAMKATEKNIVYGKKGTDLFVVIGWKDKTLTIAKLLTSESGKKAVTAMLKKVTAALKEGETIWNENIPAELYPVELAETKTKIIASDAVLGMNLSELSLRDICQEITDVKKDISAIQSFEAGKIGFSEMSSITSFRPDQKAMLFDAFKKLSAEKSKRNQ